MKVKTIEQRLEILNDIFGNEILRAYILFQYYFTTESATLQFIEKAFGLKSLDYDLDKEK